jgi:AcrR family transcriptional regulator
MARNRSARAHHQVVEAALALFAEHGIDATSMDAIAETSGVSKATIYKHWPDKDALALEALGALFGLNEEPPRFDSGDLRRDLVDALTYEAAAERRALKDRMMPHVMGYAALNRAFGEQWRSRMIELPRARLKNLLRRGMTQAKLPRQIDVELALALLLGPMLYWHIFVGRKSSSAPVPRDLAEKVVGAFWKAFSRSH